MGGNADDRKILYVFPEPDPAKTEMHTDTIKSLVDWLTTRDYGQDVDPMLIFAPGADGVPVPLTYEVEVGPWDGNDYSDRIVTVTFPDGATASGFYRIDGRA